MINYPFKEPCKTITYRAKYKFSQFFFSHQLLYERFFSFLIKGFANFEKLKIFHWQASIAHKNGENFLKYFTQNLKFLTLFLTFLDHLMANFEPPPPFFFSKFVDLPLIIIDIPSVLSYCQIVGDFNLNQILPENVATVYPLMQSFNLSQHS